MIFRVLMVCVLAAGAFYLFRARSETKPEIPPPPPILQSPNPAPVLNEAEIQKIRDAARDVDPNVRWAAIELMYRMRDPQVIPILENTLSLDTEPAMRKKALTLLREAAEKQSGAKPEVVKDLIAALKDTDRDIRITALLALSETGDARVVGQIAGMLDDSEAEVRLQALHTLSRMHEARAAAYQRLSEQLKTDYEAAVRRAQENAAQQQR